jgi:hypothetical protein
LLIAAGSLAARRDWSGLLRGHSERHRQQENGGKNAENKMRQFHKLATMGLSI